MIYPYIKVNKKVVDYLGVTEDRYKFADGNYMLWKFDLIPLGGNNDETIRMIGGVGMTSEQVREEQHGGEPTPLPEAEDERFRMTDAEVAASVPVVEDEPSEEEEIPAEEPEEAAEEEEEPTEEEEIKEEEE